RMSDRWNLLRRGYEQPEFLVQLIRRLFHVGRCEFCPRCFPPLLPPLDVIRFPCAEQIERGTSLEVRLQLGQPYYTLISNISIWIVQRSDQVRCCGRIMELSQSYYRGAGEV